MKINTMNNKEVRLSTKRARKVLNEATLPTWSQVLDNTKELHGSWVIGTTNHLHKVEDAIDEYCRSLPCDFVRSHPSNMEKKHLRNSGRSRILWQMKDIPFGGIPFSVVSHHVLKCTFSMNYNSKKRRKSALCDTSKLDETEDSSYSEDGSALKTNIEVSHNCPAKIIVKKIKRYPAFSLPSTATKQKKLSTLRTLRSVMERGTVTDIEVMFWVRLPLATLHNHAFRGKDRAIHRSIRNKIKQFIQDGDKSPDHLKSLLNNYVREYFQNDNNPPLLDDQAYYPSLQSIKNMVYNYNNRKKVPHNESKFVEKRKNSVPKSSDTEEKTCPSKIFKKEPNTLQDVVQAFCSDSLGDVLETPSNDATSWESDVSTLKERVGEKIVQLTQITHSLNDPQKLKEMLDYLSSFPVIADEGFSSPVKDYSYPLNSEYTSKQDSCPANLTPVEAYNNAIQSESCSECTKSQPVQPFMTCVTETEKHGPETNQLVPTQSYSFITKDATYAIMNNPSINYQTFKEAEIQSENNFLPTTTKVVYHIQQVPVVANDASSYVSL